MIGISFKLVYRTNDVVRLHDRWRVTNAVRLCTKDDKGMPQEN